MTQFQVCCVQQITEINSPPVVHWISLDRFLTSGKYFNFLFLKWVNSSNYSLLWIRHKGSLLWWCQAVLFRGLIQASKTDPHKQDSAEELQNRKTACARLPPYFHCDGRGRHCSVLGNVGSLHRSSSCSRHVLQREGGREGHRQD